MTTQKHTYSNTFGINNCYFGYLEYDKKFYIEVVNEIKTVSSQTFKTKDEAVKKWRRIIRK